MIRRCLSSLVVCLVFAAPARGQVPATLAAAGSCTAVFDLLNSSQVKIESSGDVTRLIGQVELPCGENRFFADQIELHGDTKEVVAIGSVVFSGPDGQIAADRVEFNASAGTGMFYNAAGLMSLGETADRAQFGNQDADIYFWGETIEQLGNRRYKITRGGFTACVQPTPRWDMQIGSMELNLNDYALARNTSDRPASCSRPTERPRCAGRR
jgi:lipopolysaccharide assembly outer membrane protein LptD (OstA)